MLFSAEAAGTAKERETLSFSTALSAPYVTGSMAWKSVSPGLGVIWAADSGCSSSSGAFVVVHRIADLI